MNERSPRLLCAAETAVWTPRPPLAAFCYAKTLSVKSTKTWSIRDLTKGLRRTRGGRRSGLQTTRGGNPRRRQWVPTPNFRPRASARAIATRTGWRSLMPPKSPAGHGNQRKSACQCPAPPARQRSRLKGAVLATRSRDRTESPREGNRPGASARPPRRARGAFGRSKLTPRPPRIPQVHR